MRIFALISGAVALKSAPARRLDEASSLIATDQAPAGNKIVWKYKLAQNDTQAVTPKIEGGDEECDENGNCIEAPAEVNAHGWRIGKWPDCPAPCSSRRSQRYRDIRCTKADGQCGGERPTDHEVCYGEGSDCGEPLDCKSEEQQNACVVKVYGKDYRQGWEATFKPGTYNYTLMEKAGATCQDISSIEVLGECCTIQVFDYGDCNKKWANGFSAAFSFGRYDKQEIENAGASNNDISCIIVRSSAAVVTGVVALFLSFF